MPEKYLVQVMYMCRQTPVQYSTVQYSVQGRHQYRRGSYSPALACAEAALQAGTEMTDQNQQTITRKLYIFSETSSVQRLETFN